MVVRALNQQFGYAWNRWYAVFWNHDADHERYRAGFTLTYSQGYGILLTGYGGADGELYENCRVEKD